MKQYRILFFIFVSCFSMHIQGTAAKPKKKHRERWHEKPQEVVNLKPQSSFLTALESEIQRFTENCPKTNTPESTSQKNTYKKIVEKCLWICNNPVEKKQLERIHKMLRTMGKKPYNYGAHPVWRLQDLS